MEIDDEKKLIDALLSGEPLLIDCAGVFAHSNADRTGEIYLSMAGHDGKRYFVPLGRDLALMLGEQMVRAVDAIDAGLVLQSLPQNTANGDSAPLT